MGHVEELEMLLAGQSRVITPSVDRRERRRMRSSLKGREKSTSSFTTTLEQSGYPAETSKRQAAAHVGFSPDSIWK